MKKLLFCVDVTVANNFIDATVFLGVITNRTVYVASSYRICLQEDGLNCTNVMHVSFSRPYSRYIRDSRDNSNIRQCKNLLKILTHIAHKHTLYECIAPSILVGYNVQTIPINFSYIWWRFIFSISWFSQPQNLFRPDNMDYMKIIKRFGKPI